MGRKLKTNKSVQKRFRKTKGGGYKKSRAGRRHLLQSKASKRKRKLRKRDLVKSTHESHLRRLLPYA